MHFPRKRSGFTLVELLVVIGIIALLISILLPSLNNARRAAMKLKCSSNMTQCGMAMSLYAAEFKGKTVPSILWGKCPATPAYTSTQYGPGNLGINASNYSSGQSRDDAWAIVLTAQKYLTEPALAPTSPVLAATTVTVCPSVRDYLIGTNLAGVTTTNQVDGFNRRLSLHVKPGLLVDIGYCINGGNGNSDGDPKFPFRAACFDGSRTYPTTPAITRWKNTAKVVALMDGAEWKGGIESAFRITGARHGRFDKNKVRGTTNVSGITNVLFMDGHVESVDRALLPANNDEWMGNFVGGVVQRAPKSPYIFSELHK